VPSPTLPSAASGASAPLEPWIPALYAELHSLAERELRKERRDPVLQTTALVHEAYLRLADQHDLLRDSRDRFLALAATVIRRVLVDHARKRDADRRGGAWKRIELEDSFALTSESSTDLVALDSALTKLASLSERQARVVELRFFAGSSVDETARILGVAPRTVDGEWAVARAWLARELAREAS
jgi:RNA polymerase sigma factor (TIGR02999 family)